MFTRQLRSIPSLAAQVHRGARKLGSSHDLEAEIINKVVINKVVIFSKSSCPYCRRVKQLFSDIDQPTHVVELNEVKRGADMQRVLQEMTGQRTVPNIFVNGKHLGGCDDTMAAHDDGRLKQMLE